MVNNSQKGIFSIEMAFVLIGMSACLFFFFDLGFQQIRKSQLERVSYSMVSVLKERSLFFKGSKGKPNLTINVTEVEKIKKLASKFLGVDEESISVIVGSIVNDGKLVELNSLSKNVPCSSHVKIEKSMATKFESSNKYTPIYQVTICQIIPSWYENVVSGGKVVSSRVLYAQSSFIGR